MNEISNNEQLRNARNVRRERSEESQQENPEPTVLASFREKCRTLFSKIKAHLLLSMILFAVVLGLSFGFALKDNTNLNSSQREYIRFPGELYLRALQFLILPLISFNLIASISQISLRESNSGSWKFTMVVIALYSASLMSSASIGLILVGSIRPGFVARTENYLLKVNSDTRKIFSSIDFVLDILRFF